MMAEAGGWLLDLALAGLILALGIVTVFSRDLQRAVVMFIAFGLALALAWLRLAAPDLALAEAAIGSGLTGVLLLKAINHAAQPNASDAGNSGELAEPKDVAKRISRFGGYLLSAAALLPVAGPLLYAIFTSLAQGIPAPSGVSLTLAEQAQQALPESGVSNPVTAVLLNFRLYDTLLELAVLLAAVMGIVVMRSASSSVTRAPEPVLLVLRWLVPVICLTAGYLLWIGAHAPGGAFQAGAMLAGAFALVYLCGLVKPGAISALIWRGSLVAAVAAFLGSAALSFMLGLPILTLPPAWAGGQILVMEIFATLSVAATLAVAVAGGMIWMDHQRANEQEVRVGD